MTQPMALVPREDTEAMWGGLARDIVMWSRFQNGSGRVLHDHLRRKGVPVPDWLREAIPNTDHVPPKGAVAGAIYRAMLDAAPSAGCVPREMVEWVARALFKEQRQEAVRAGAVFYSETFNWRVCLSEARVAIAALGLTVVPAADTARNGEAE